MIASGPTVKDTTSKADALAVLKQFGAQPPDVPISIFAALQSVPRPSGSDPFDRSGPLPDGRDKANNARNIVIGNNATALEAAAVKARELGFAVKSLGSNNAGEARAVGHELAELCRLIRDEQSDLAPPVCVLSGGEPVVKLVPTDQPHKGGRNQELALAALQHLWNDGLDRIAILSGGTDGEDGPTNAAGAMIDETLRQAAIGKGLDPADFLAINNSYPFFEQTNGLLLTGPTHTNVMDLRVAVIRC